VVSKNQPGLWQNRVISNNFRRFRRKLKTKTG
jgi:hypothetical protein